MLKNCSNIYLIFLLAGVLLSTMGWENVSYGDNCRTVIDGTLRTMKRSQREFTPLFVIPENVYYSIAFQPDSNHRPVKLGYPYVEGFQGNGVQEAAEGFQFGLVAGFDANGSMLVEVWVNGKFQRWALSAGEQQTVVKNEFSSRWLNRNRYQYFKWGGKSFEEYRGADRTLLETYLNGGFYGNKRYLKRKGVFGHFYKVLHMDQNGDLILLSNQQIQIQMKPEDLLDFQFSSESQRCFTGEVYWEISGVTSQEMVD